MQGSRWCIVVQLLSEQQAVWCACFQGSSCVNRFGEAAVVAQGRQHPSVAGVGFTVGAEAGLASRQGAGPVEHRTGYAQKGHRECTQQQTRKLHHMEDRDGTRCVQGAENAVMLKSCLCMADRRGIRSSLRVCSWLQCGIMMPPAAAAAAALPLLPAAAAWTAVMLQACAAA